MILQALTLLPLLLYFGALSLLFLYGINCYIMIFLHRRAKARHLRQDQAIWTAWQTTTRDLPRVTVQLPVYNERYVIERLIETVIRLEHPKDRLEIQVLDDSTDETTAIATRLVERYRRAGFDISLLHRTKRAGYKAGALKEGLEVARGEFIAIFDADFMPEPDFLSKTLPFFQDPGIGMVQARWGHINRDYSLLTLTQSFGIDGHFWVEQAARCWSGLFMNFNGTAGIWRRRAIDDAGGWHADTLTEDLDLSYRAQLRGWRMKFLPQVVCPAEIPVQISAAKSQQHRWAKGSIQTAIKLVPQILRAKVPRFTKVQAVFHLTNYMVHPLMLVVALSSPLHLWFDGFLSLREHLLAAAAFFSIATFGPSSMYLYAQRQLYPDWTRRLKYFPALLVFGTGIALNNTKAILEAFFHVGGAFVRTPKFRIEKDSDTWVGKRYRPPISWLSFLEALLAVYCVYGVSLFLQRGRHLVDPFLLLYTIGFATVALMSLWESLRISVISPKRLIPLLFAILLLPAGAAQPTGVPAPVLARSPWPKYRGDKANTGRISHAGPASNRLKWTFATGKRDEEGGIETDPVIGPDGSVYVGANNGIFYALDPETGDVRWAFPTRFDTFAIYSSPFADDSGTVYFGAKDGTVYALRAPRKGIMGEVVWSLNLGTTIQTSPTFTPDGTLVIGADDWAYYGITPPRGDAGPQVKWRFQTQGTLITSPAVDADGTVFVASMDGNVYALVPPEQAGQPVTVRWTFSSGDRDDKGGFENAPVIDDAGTLYIAANNGILYALDTKTGQVQWSFDGVARSGYRTFAIFSSVAVGPDRTIHFGGKNGVLYALRESRGFFSTGAQVVWRYNLGAGIQSSPLRAADGTIYLGDEKGMLHAVRAPTSGEWSTPLWTFPTKGVVISSAALGADGTLYTASMDGTAYAFHDTKTGKSSHGPLSGTWYGTYRDSGGKGKMIVVVVQRGTETHGIWRLQGGARGSLEGKVQGDRGTFTLSPWSKECPGGGEGTLVIAKTTLNGRYRGRDCRGKIDDGTFELGR